MTTTTAERTGPAGALAVPVMLVVGLDDVVTHLAGTLSAALVEKSVGQPLVRLLPVAAQAAFREALEAVRRTGGNRMVHWNSAGAAFPGDKPGAGRCQAFLCRGPAQAAGNATVTVLLGRVPELPGPRADDAEGAAGALHAKLDQAQRQLMQSEKMAAVGQLAAGVAHEINNPVGFVFSNLGTLTGYVRDLLRLTDAIDTATDIAQLREAKATIDYAFIRDDVESLIAESEDGIDRIRRIVAALKDFTHQGPDDFAPSDINRGITTTLKVVNSGLKYKAEVIEELGELPDVECVASQINQIVMNLLVNAGDAMTSFGRIVIRTGTADDQVWFEVEDNGSGMSPEVQARIFEPFYTTKPVGKGTGLGLSLSYNIIEKHHGRIEWHSRVGEGTRIRVWLPTRQPDAAA